MKINNKNWVKNQIRFCERGEMFILSALFILFSFTTQAQLLDYEQIILFNKPFNHVNYKGKVKSIITDYYKITVDSAGNVSKTITNPSISTGNVEHREFDSLGRITVEATILNEKLDGGLRYFHSENEDIIELLHKYGSGRTTEDVVLTFFNDDLKIEAVESFYLTNQPKIQHTIYYNQDFKIDSVAAIRQDRLIRSFKYKYYGNDSVVRKEYKNGSSRIEIVTQILDSTGQIKTKNYASTIFWDAYSTHFKYDKYGNIKEQLFLGGVGLATLPFREDESQLIEFEYEYDDIGNWTICNKIVNGTLYEISERKIEYY